MLFILFFFKLINSQTPTITKIWEYGGCFKYGCNTGWYQSPIYTERDDGKKIIIGSCENIYGIDFDTHELLYQNQVPKFGTSQRTNTQILLIENFVDNEKTIVTGHPDRTIGTWDLYGNLKWSKQLDLPSGCNNNPEIYGLAAAKLKESDQMYIFAQMNAEWGQSEERSHVVQLIDKNGDIHPIKLARGREDGFMAGIYQSNIGFFESPNANKNDLSFVLPNDCAWIPAFDHNLNAIEVDNVFTEAHSNQYPPVWGNVPFNFNYEDDYINEYSYPRGHFTRVGASSVKVNNKSIIAIAGTLNGDQARSFYFSTLFLLNPDRTRLDRDGMNWKQTPRLGDWNLYDYQQLDFSMSNIAPVDLNADGNPEFIFPSGDSKIHAFSLSSSSSEFMSFPYNILDSAEVGLFRHASEIAVYQNSGDTPIIVFTSWGQRTHANQKGKLHFIRYDGNELKVVNLPDPKSTSNHVHNGAKAAPTLFKPNATSNIYITLQTITSGNVLFEIHNTKDAKILWSTGRGSFLRQGRVLTEIQTGEFTDYRLIVSNILGVSLSLLAFGFLIVIVIFIFSFTIYLSKSKKKK